MVKFITVISATVLLVVEVISDPYTYSDAANLQSDLLANYSPKNRPDNTTYVSIELGIMHITELDIVAQRLHVVGFLLAYWKDSRLTWTPSSYGDMVELFILLSDIWAPPLVLNNAADEIVIMNDDSDAASVHVYLTYDGDVVWMAPANFVAQCSVNIKYYPFDSQECDIVVSSWLFLERHLYIFSTATEVNLDIFTTNGEWDITKTSVFNASRQLLGYEMPSIIFKLNLQRKYSYYIMNMILPVVFLAIMAPFVFILPIESGEKIGYSLTILLSMSVLMTLVSDSIPPSSTYICILSVYLLVTFIICALLTMITAITCRLHDFHSKGYPLSLRMQSFTAFLAKLTRSTRTTDKVASQTEGDKCKRSESQLNIFQSSKVGDVNMNHTKILEENTKTWNRRMQEVEDTDSEDEKNEQYTWEDFANLLDKFNFVFSFLLTVVVTLVVMILLEVGET